MRQQAGFTLIEVMVAMAITAVVAVMAYYGIDSAIRLSSAAEQEADNLRELNRAFDVIARDLRQIVPRSVRDPAGYGRVSAFVLEENGDPVLRFSRSGWTNPEPQRFQRSQLQRVHYRYEDEKLIRVSWQMLDRYPDSKEQAIVLLEDVSELRVRVMQAPDISQLSQSQLGDNVFLNLPASATQEQWKEVWPPARSDGLQEASNSLPSAIEITLNLKRWGEIRRLFQLVDNSGELYDAP